MPTIVMTKLASKLDGSVKAKAMTFLEKLGEDDTNASLHIEPINNSVDPRVRTGRVDQYWRAVMFRLDHGGEPHYVIQGVWPHDDAIALAKKLRMRTNPINGIAQFDEVEPVAPTFVTPAAVATASESSTTPLLESFGRTRAELVDQLGLAPDVADRAMAATDIDEVLELAQGHEGWVGLVLVDLAAGESVASVIERNAFETPTTTGDDDVDLINAMRHEAAQAEFAFIENQDELRRVIEAGDFGAWRVFLHPEQRRYVDQRYSGPARLSGGAGTGKTVVLLHRARDLARRKPSSRIVLTTFTKNLAEMLHESLVQLDPGVPLAGAAGLPGVHVSGVDSLAARIVSTAGAGIATAVEAVLGEARTDVVKRAPGQRWQSVIDVAGAGLPGEIANDTFFAAEYGLVVLPARITTLDDYLRVRRPGRGVALDRAKRTVVWGVIENYRAQNRINGEVDYAEAAAIAAEYLSQHGPRADHVLVDEGQDLTPSHWQLLRALVAPGPDDIFIAEDSHQRIYGPKLVLSRYGIRIVGRSRRLTLNYRTTAQNLRYAMSVLEGGSYVDIEGEPEVTGYRSARTGPVPELLLVHGLSDELTAVAKTVNAWLADGTAPETIAVLVPDRYQRDRVVKSLGEHDVPARAVDSERPPAGRPLVMTMHRAKGMEFSRVVLAGVGAESAAEKTRRAQMDESERADAQLRQRSLVYVAATRARDELVVLTRA